ncbi:MAG: tetratricopeptide repeat protein [Deltaproteobacteria bacterium]|nr:tetratricopeptide repeat protein [Deltaproteobacteria bacterium]
MSYMRLLPLLVVLACTPPAPVVAEPPAEPPAPPVPVQKALAASLSERPAAPVLKVAAEAPMRLTASDGTGLVLRSLEAKGVLQDPLGFVELRMTFDNPRDQVIEGQFQITLPARASISRFAMLIDGRWQEGEVVERQAARRAYEDFLHRRQDPALLEQQAGNEFSARVFPIPARGSKEIILSYSEERPDSAAPFRIPLAGLPAIPHLSARVIVPGGETFEMKRDGKAPDGDFVVNEKAAGQGLRHEGMFVTRVTPLAGDVGAAPIPSLFILIDTSASRALGLNKQWTIVQDLLARLPAETPVDIAVFDQTAEPIFRGRAGDMVFNGLAAATQRRALGASNLRAAIAYAASLEGRFARGVLITDGVATAGEIAGDKLIAATRTLKGVERIDAIAVGGLRDDAMLQKLVRGTLRNDGLVIDGDLPSEAIAHKLNRMTRSGIRVSAAGAKWIWPETLDGVQPGDEVLVFGELDKNAALTLAIGDGKPFQPVLSAGMKPLVERAIAGAQIQGLLFERDTVFAGDPKKRAETEREVTAISVKHRVLSPFTALLVLETEQDYARFGIDHRALADILTVSSTGLDWIHRSAQPLQIAKTQTAVAQNKPPKNDARKKEPFEREASKDSKKGKRADREDRDAPAKEAIALGAVEEAAESEPKADRAERSRASDDKPTDSVAVATQPRPAAQARPDAPPPPAMAPPPAAEPARIAVAAEQPQAPQIDPYAGDFAAIMRAVKSKKIDDAIALATKLLAANPGDVMALLGLGEAMEAKGDLREAARAYGSLIDLFPARADMRRFAGERLERLAQKKHEAALILAIDTYEKAVAERPDHPASHRLLAFALIKTGQAPAAFLVLENALKQEYPSGRFAGVQNILREDLGLVGAAWIKQSPKMAAIVTKRLEAYGATLEDAPSLRFVLNWETDANDVDFHIYDGQGGHASYSNMQLPSGGVLYGDVTTGYGPECFTIRADRGHRAGPYKLQAHYYSRGPMGYGMGKLQVIEHDGKGKLTFDERPFVVMQDQAYLDLGKAI